MNKMHKKGSYPSGISIIEFIVAMGIFVIIAGGSLTGVLGTLLSNKKLETRIEGLGLSKEGIEAAMSIRNKDWNNLSNGTYGLDNSTGFWTFSGTQDLIKDKYLRKITIEDAEIEGDSSWEIKKITSTVSWDYSPGKKGQVESSIYLSNWRTAKAAVLGGPEYGTCKDYCISLGYKDGSCWAFAFWCSLFGRTYIPFGSQFCFGSWSNVCCCKN